MREAIANILLISWCIALLVHFCMIADRGQVLIQEPNPYILGLEIILVAATILFGIFNITRLKRR